MAGDALSASPRVQITRTLWTSENMQLESNSYDAVPYTSHAFVQTHPDRLATIATLFGLKCKPVESCRVLEIGCARGGNVLPMAEQLPDSEFVGFDLSEVQITEAQQLAEKCQFSNIQLLHRDIMDFGDEFGTFDYIICHGVFSWVPRPVQKKILSLCGTLLNPNGIATVSYNTFPGWHMRYMIRDMICYHAAQFGSPETKVQQARALLDFLAGNAAQNTPFGVHMKTEAELLRSHEDAYLYHEYLETVNDPIYFFQFIERAEAEGLQYLGETEMAAMWSGHIPPDVSSTLERITSDLIQMEQYVDFLRNRTFRQTLLCRKDLTIDRTLRASDLQALHVASNLIPVDKEINTADNSEVRFCRRNNTKLGMSSKAPLLKSALWELIRTWPNNIPFDELLSTSYRQVAGTDMISEERWKETEENFGRSLLQIYMNGFIEFFPRAFSHSTTVSEKPQASRLARIQAESDNRVTTLRHQAIALDDVGRQVLQWLDGSNDRDSLVELLREAVAANVLRILPSKDTENNETEADKFPAIIDQTLNHFAQAALLM
jgi:methyltransferase-like protein/2-polyprenyl-3-methyl-5-hydroxy-6-metoxy-1,4-benzoquinol methylase